MTIEQVKEELARIIEATMYLGDGRDDEPNRVPKALHPDSLAREVYALALRLEN